VKKIRSREEMARVGRIGGLISASRLTASERTARATANGNTTLQRYGIEYYRSIATSKKKKKD
jgi:hypothetical protein